MPFDDDNFDSNEFDRQFNKTQQLARKGFKFAGIAAAIMLTLVGAAIVTVLWAIVQLVQHFVG